MEIKFGFTKMNLTEFETWIKNLRVSRTVLKIQQYHTYIPSHIRFSGNNHFGCPAVRVCNFALHNSNEKD